MVADEGMVKQSEKESSPAGITDDGRSELTI
jgi:hypothetical protein